MSRYKLSPAADADFAEIYRRSYSSWGEDQAHKFLDKMEATLERIGDNPSMGIARPDLRSDYRSIPHHPYVIIYRISESDVEVARILDARRDIRSLFRSGS